MNHNFTPSQLDEKTCIKCKRIEIEHSSVATCESCYSIGNCELAGDILLCVECQTKEKAVIDTPPYVNDASTPDTQQIEEKASPATILANLMKELKYDNSIRTKEDIFNAEILSMSELESLVMADASVEAEHKYYKLVELVRERYNHFKDILWQVRDIEIDIANRQHAEQRYLNNLASKLRTEEREKLKLEDISYVPKEPPKKIGTKQRMSAEERVIETTARLMFAPRDTNNKILWAELSEAEREGYIERAKIQFKTVMRNNR